MKTRGMTLLRRIISICLLVALTAGAVAVARRLGSRPDPRRIAFLRSAGPLEIAARRASAGVEDRAQDAKPPVVAQAEAFALYLRPPEPIKRTPPKPRARPVPVEVPPVAIVSAPVKYRLLGINYHQSKPEESKALVWEAGGGPKWVAPGEQLDSIMPHT